MKQIRAIPYYTQKDDLLMKQCAKELREVFLPQLRRRLKMHHLNAWNQHAIIDFVAKYKHEYPYFFRADIAKYYPNANAYLLVAMAQIAHRDLFGLTHVSKNFKEKFLQGMQRWVQSLPKELGIPMGSSMSIIMSALGLIPIWLGIKKKFDVKFIVFVDDVLILCKSDYDARRVWIFLAEELEKTLKLHLNVDKTVSGRFAKKSVIFCGWCFSGGYVRIEQEKVKRFEDRFLECIKRSKRDNTRAFIKKINRKITGFGNYYKHGNVLRQFEKLDCFIRKEVRKWLSGNANSKAYDNKGLEDLGLHSLEKCYLKAHKKKGSPEQTKLRPVERYYAEKPAAFDYGVLNKLAQDGETMTKQLHDIVKLLRQQNKLLEKIFNETI
jgi:GTPase SAR1 family protein